MKLGCDTVGTKACERKLIVAERLWRYYNESENDLKNIAIKGPKQNRMKLNTLQQYFERSSDDSKSLHKI